MGMFVHGIGASENIDSSGEIVSIAGLDISSLALDGVMNWEHKSDQPSQVVGKILKAKKIFSEKDCEDDYQLHFWEKCRTPYLYVMGELLDDYTDSAREVAGKFRYDADKKAQNERNMMNFSVEGSKISKDGITVTRSIARKITITILPCNKAAIAEMVSVAPAKPKKGDIDELFKTEQVEIEVLQIDKNSKLWDLLKKEELEKKNLKKDMAGGQMSNLASTALSGVGPTSAGGVIGGEGMMRSESEMNKAAPKLRSVSSHGTKIGSTSSGKAVHSHGMIGSYGFNPGEHKEAAAAHHAAAKGTKDQKSILHHTNKARLHEAAAHTQHKKTMKASVGIRRPAEKPKVAPKAVEPKHDKLHHPDLSGTIKYRKSENMNKAMTAGSGIASPDRLEGGAALAKENLDKAMGYQTAHDPGAAAIDKPLKSKDSRMNVVNPHFQVGIKKNSGAQSGNEEESQMVKGGAYSGNVPKDAKIKELQQKIDSKTYKPDPKKIADKMIQHPDKPLKKSEMLQRAEAEYASWSKREQFEAFMSQRMPSLTKSEIKVIGQAMLFHKSLKLEKALHSFVDKSEDMDKSEWKQGPIGHHTKHGSVSILVHPHEGGHRAMMFHEDHGHMPDKDIHGKSLDEVKKKAVKSAKSIDKLIS